MRKPLQEFEGDNYERPNQLWLCGLSDEGTPCPSGPGRGGRCPGATACHPLREGDRWVCNRSAARGGTCETGPTPDGQCCLVYQCKPLRSLRLRRGRFVVGCLLATLGGLMLLLSTSWRNEILAPGELSTHHAQLLQRGDSTKRCASCHAAGDQTFGQWLQHATSSELAHPTQTELCLECHQQQITRVSATWAHNIDPQVLLAKSTNDAHRRVDPRKPLACATCHREHHGASHDLAWMSDNACQACHQQQYESFATDHPDFEAWPTQRRTRIAFDHGAHQLKHFPKEKQEFACAVCHTNASDGAFQQTLGYEETCASCHDSKIATSWESGLSLFNLPMIDVEALRNAGHNVGQWPDAAQGDFDGALSPIAKLLLVGDPSAASALQTLGPDFDFFDVDPDDAEQLAAASQIVIATKRLLYEISQQGQNAIRKRVESILQRELTQQEFSAVAARLSPDNLTALTQQWLTNLPAEFDKASPAGQPPSQSDTSLPDRETARQLLAAGGWFNDSTTLSLRYRPIGHADPWMTSWLDILAEASSGSQSALAKPLLKQMMAPTAAGQCGSCHSLDWLDDDRYVVQWLVKQPTSTRATFTKFAHGPHLTLSQLADCQGCHQINPLADVMASYASDSPTTFQIGFQPINKQSCTECHTPKAAGDSCLQCHNYHVGAD